MKLLLALLYLSASLFKARANSHPCMLAEFPDSSDVFIKRHLSSGTPNSMDPEPWEIYLKENTDCERSLQYFISPKDRDRVEDICTPFAGKQQSGNYCISKSKFTYTAVHSELDTCIVRNISVETKHIIVACDMVRGMCRPTHLENNRDDLVPRVDSMDCYLELMSGVVQGVASQLCLPLSLLWLTLWYLMG